MKSIRRKLVIVGDHAVGKTSLLTVIAVGKFPTEVPIHPMVYGGLVMDVRADGMIVELGFWDTACEEEEDYDRYRPLNYPDTAIVVICFAMDNLKSLQNITDRWYPEVVHFALGVPILLLACKTDLLPLQEGGEGFSSTAKRPTGVTREQAHAVANEIGAVRYMECSAQTGEGVHEFLQASGEIAASWNPFPHRPRHTSCQIL